MKFLRIGKEGQEIPVVLDKDGKYRNLSSVIKDLNPESINFETLDKIKDIGLVYKDIIAFNDSIATEAKRLASMKKRHADELEQIKEYVKNMLDDGEKIKVGKILVKIPRKSAKSGDITGGLPRVTELFEARNPSNPAVVSEIDGVISFGKIKRGNRETN